MNKQIKEFKMYILICIFNYILIVMKYVRGIDFKPSREDEVRRRSEETKRVLENLRVIRQREQLRYKRGW